MARCDVVRVEDRLRELDDRLRGPARLKADLLTEARHALEDAVEAYRDRGLSAAEAERRAVAEFGDPAGLGPAYQAELAAGSLRGLALRVLAVAGVLVAAGDLTWRGSSWSGTGPRPPAGYLLLSGSLDAIWLAIALLAAAGLLLVAASARSAHPALPRLARLVGLGLTAALGLGALNGAALYAWSLGLWEAALTWPPMIVGGVAVTAALLWLARAARSWLLAAR
ncbi:permease prefix domain 1-containing protein [Micromonospora sp. NPDC048830]|uniref:permease prefix domain 1-containing protein n=1 Tax=Micromonospora sp. NPDC048830 TaxID=3364257 RepID=UPI00371D48F7